MREIDPEKISSGKLSFAEAEYLRVRGRLPADYVMPENKSGEAEDEESEYLPRRSIPLQEQTVPVMGNLGGIVDETNNFNGVGSNYSNEEGWNNDKRRAELAKRSLSVSGPKEELISRLRRSDTNELSDEDYEIE
jgi:hypothetical protein